MQQTVAILFSSYGPYHISRVKGCAKSYDYYVKPVELAHSQEQYPWQADKVGQDFTVTSVIQETSLEKTNIIKLLLQLNRTLNQINPHVLAIAGYFQPSMIFALLWCNYHHRPAILFSETTEADAPRSRWREVIKQLIVSQYQAALVGGQPHKRYMMKLGMPAEAIFLGYDVVGNESFHPNRIKHFSPPINKPYFLAVNRFIPKKNLSFLISCYAEYRKIFKNSAWDLVICGDGELRPQLEEQIANLALTEYVHLPGFLQQEAMLPYFAHAGCFIHASIQEQWGLVVNEAMAAGLPVLVSRNCGCFEDLVIEGVNGFGFDPESQQELTQLMIKISSNAVDLSTMGQAALEHIQKFSPNYFADNLLQAVRYALAHT